MQKARDSMRASEKPQEGAKRSSQGPVLGRVLEPNSPGAAVRRPIGDHDGTTTPLPRRGGRSAWRHHPSGAWHGFGGPGAVLLGGSRPWGCP